MCELIQYVALNASASELGLSLEEQSFPKAAKFGGWRGLNGSSAAALLGTCATDRRVLISSEMC